MPVNIERFLKQKVEELETDEVIRTEELYDDIPNVSIKRIFSILHQKINELIKFMYSKRNYHFNANQSRELLKCIKIYEEMQYALKDTAEAFNLNDDYYHFLNNCKSFLKESGGSTIPPDLEHINLQYYEPIFYFAQHVEVQGISEERVYQTKLIGKGSYAEVYKYHDDFYNQDIVIKKALHGLNVKELERFKKEFCVMKELYSPFILKVYRYDEKKNEYYAEFADCTLATYITENKDLSLKERYNLGMQVLRGFSYIHSKDILHRDISISNILIKKYDDFTRIKISDFGLVKERDSNLTSLDSEVKGSLNDESRLRAIGFAKYDMPCEIYALTRLILFILTGKSTIYSISNDDIKEFGNRGTNPDVKKRFNDVNVMIDEFAKLYKILDA